jgi:hypothetical protein
MNIIDDCMKLSPTALSSKSFVEKLRTAHDLAYKLYVCLEDLWDESSRFGYMDFDKIEELYSNADILQDAIYECYNDEE